MIGTGQGKNEDEKYRIYLKSDMIRACVFIMLFLYLGLNYSWAIDIKPNDQKIEKFVNEQGFYQNTVNAITSDEDGNIWIATPNGLVCYDGYTFDYYYSDRKSVV